MSKSNTTITVHLAYIDDFPIIKVVDANGNQIELSTESEINYLCNKLQSLRNWLINNKTSTGD